ncbi:hypothetical protein HGRIS_013458 [Hohenbuehelia grisea]|uniref:Cytochrome b561 domain-containing protein n=1 Tax=Hohenbuehelia grisea TaxID=104357 RepID=A0ABR3IVP5_9AGAR
MPALPATPDPNQQDYELLLPPNETDQSQAAPGQDLPKTSMGFDEQELKPERRPGDVYAEYAALISAAVFVVVTWVGLLIHSPAEKGWFALHPPLQSASIALITYGILTLQPTSQPKTKAAGFQRHQLVIFFVALPCITVGTLAVMYNKYLNEAPHFMSWHGTLGIIVMVWILLQVALGGGSVWFKGVAFGGGAKAKAVWKYHRLSGYLLFPLLLFVGYLGAVILGAVYTRVRLSKMNFT